MASLSYILVLCVGLLAMVNAGESGGGSPLPPQPQGWQGEGKTLQENQAVASSLS